MSDLFDDFKKVLNKDIVSVFIQYFKDPKNKITDNLNDFVSNPQTFLEDIVENFSNKKDFDKKRESYTDIENVTNIDPIIYDDYDDLYKRLTLIEESMIQIENILKEKN